MATVTPGDTIPPVWHIDNSSGIIATNNSFISGKAIRGRESYTGTIDKLIVSEAFKKTIKRMQKLKESLFELSIHFANSQKPIKLFGTMHTNRKPRKVRDRNYFFRLRRYLKRIKK